MTAIRIGIDLDNTIVCYDRIFEELAVSSGLSSAASIASKQQLRDHLRQTGREDRWTEIQGEVYGPMMEKAIPFPGVECFFAKCVEAGHSVFIVSHRTKYPYRGPRHDLHSAASSWLEQNGFTGTAANLSRHDVFLELTREAKLNRIRELNCTHFVDDLPEFLSSPEFPNQTKQILFDPHDVGPSISENTCVNSWADLSRYFQLS